MIIIEYEGKIPSINHAYSRNRAGRRYLSREGKIFKEAIKKSAIAQNRHIRIYKRRIRLWIEVSFKRKNRDISNVIKLIEDSLSGLVYEDDRQVDELIVRRTEEGGDKVRILVEEIGIKKIGYAGYDRLEFYDDIYPVSILTRYEIYRMNEEERRRWRKVRKHEEARGDIEMSENGIK